ncbi:hypothetical protein ACO0SA_000981 [Hanseniaspora valbyensis]
MNNYKHLLSSMDITADKPNTIESNNDLDNSDLSISSLLKFNNIKLNNSIDDDNDDRVSLISEPYDDRDDDDDDIYNNLPINKNSKCNFNLSSPHNSQTTLLLNNYKNNILNNATTPIHGYFDNNFSNTSNHNTNDGNNNNNNNNNNTSSFISVSPFASRPNSTRLKVKYKKPHIEDIIDNANTINMQVKKEGFHNLPIGNTITNSFMMSNGTGDVAARTTHSLNLTTNKNSEVVSVDNESLYEYPLMNNFISNDFPSYKIEYFIQKYFNECFYFNDTFCNKKELNKMKRLDNIDYYIELSNKEVDEVIDVLIEKAELRSHPKDTQDSTDVLPQIFHLNEPALSFSQFMRERVCSNFDKFTMISVIKQLDTDFEHIFISKEKQHKFIFTLLKYNYKLNNDVLTISMRSFEKMSGLKKKVLTTCELELIQYLFNN